MAQGHSQRPDGLNNDKVMPLVETGWYSRAGTVWIVGMMWIKCLLAAAVFDELLLLLTMVMQALPSPPAADSSC